MVKTSLKNLEVLNRLRANKVLLRRKTQNIHLGFLIFLSLFLPETRCIKLSHNIEYNEKDEK